MKGIFYWAMVLFENLEKKQNPMKNLINATKAIWEKHSSHLIALLFVWVFISAQPAVAEPERLFAHNEAEQSSVSLIAGTPFDEIQIIPQRVRATVTAYSSAPGQTDDSPFTAANGKQVFDGLVACPREYAFGTKVIINNRLYECGDRMALKHKDRFDIWMPTTAQALLWGAREVDVIILHQI